jgi:hypothetical protein
MLFSENYSHSSMNWGDKLALGSLVINLENDSNGILARNVVCCYRAAAFARKLLLRGRRGLDLFYNLKFLEKCPTPSRFIPTFALATCISR